MRTKTTMLAALLIPGLLANSTAIRADDVEDSIREGLELYKAGEFKDAVESLGYAIQLIQQKKGQTLESLLPAPLEGWEATDASSQAAGAAMMGGGITAEREYRKGEAVVTIRIVTDSPLLQGMMVMFSNPMFAASSGGKLERIKRQKAIVNYDASNRSGEIKIVVDRRFLVTIEGDKVTPEDLRAYAEAMDYKALKDMP